MFFSSRFVSFAVEEIIVSALRDARDPIEDPIVDLRAAITMAYDQVRLARRYLEPFDVAAELSTQLQHAEADLVRAFVEVDRLERETIEGRSSKQPVSINPHIAILPRSA
jgi:hypothetical protein